MGISFNIKIPEKILKERNVEDYGKVQKKLDKDVLAYCEPYVPKRSGALIISGRRGTKPGSGIIVYSSPYARYQYYGKSKKGKNLNYRGGGLRGSYWFDRMKASNQYTLLQQAAIAAGGKASSPSQAYIKSRLTHFTNNIVHLTASFIRKNKSKS